MITAALRWQNTQRGKPYNQSINLRLPLTCLLYGSLYTAWLANNKANGIPTYKVDPAAAGGSLGNLFDNPFNSPGLYNSFFNVCGNDVPGSDLKHDPDDMKLVSNNILSAQDVSRSRLWFSV
jgi:hypothetical protein